MQTAFMSFSCPRLSFDAMVELAHNLGYDGIEPRADAGHEHGVELDATPEQRAAFKARAEADGIAICCLAIGARYAEPTTVEQQVEETRHYLDLAADVGAPRLRVFGGRIPAEIDREQAIDQVATALQALAAPAAQRGVTICLETHDDWCDPAHVVAVMERVDQTAVAVNWDIMHPVRTAGYTVDQSYVLLQPWIQHAHIHDGPADPSRLVYLPLGQGDIDNQRALALLYGEGATAGDESRRYTGFVSGEWINWEPYDVHLPRELATLHAYARALSL